MIEAGFALINGPFKWFGFLFFLFILIDYSVYYGGMWIYRNFTGASKWEAMDKFRFSGKITAFIIVFPIFLLTV